MWVSEVRSARMRGQDLESKIEVSQGSWREGTDLDLGEKRGWNW